MAGPIEVRRGVPGFPGARGAVAALCLAALGGPAWAAIPIYGVQNAAMDQPRINVLIRDTSDTPLSYDGEDPITGFPATFYNIEMYYDTGASNVVFGNDTASLFGLTLDPAGPVFEDAGVGGTVQFDVALGHTFELAPYDPSTPIDTGTFTQYSQRFESVRAAVGPLNAPDNPLHEIYKELLGYNPFELNVAGMPLFMNKTVVMDARSLNAFVNNGGSLDNLANLPELHTHVYDSDPGGIDANPNVPELDLHVQLSYTDFTSFTSTTGGDPPSIAHNPFIGPDPVATFRGETTENVPAITIGANGKSTQGSYLLDTGGAATIISEAQANAVDVRYKPGAEAGTATPQLQRYDAGTDTWIDLTSAEQFRLTLTGIAGEVPVAGFWLNSLLLPTIEGQTDPNQNVEYFDVPVLVLDISIEDPVTEDILTIDGIFGMNLLFGSVGLSEPLTLESLFGAPMSGGAYDWVVFDEPSGTLGLTLIPEPGTLLALAGVGALALVRRRR